MTSKFCSRPGNKYCQCLGLQNGKVKNNYYWLEFVLQFKITCTFSLPSSLSPKDCEFVFTVKDELRFHSQLRQDQTETKAFDCKS